MVLIIDTTRDGNRLIALRTAERKLHTLRILSGRIFLDSIQGQAFTQKLQYHSDTPSTLDRTTSSSAVLLEVGYSVSDAPRPRSYPKRTN